MSEALNSVHRRVELEIQSTDGLLYRVNEFLFQRMDREIFQRGKQCHQGTENGVDVRLSSASNLF